MATKLADLSASLDVAMSDKRAKQALYDKAKSSEDDAKKALTSAEEVARQAASDLESEINRNLSELSSGTPKASIVR